MYVTAALVKASMSPASWLYLDETLARDGASDGKTLSDAALEMARDGASDGKTLSDAALEMARDGASDGKTLSDAALEMDSSSNGAASSARFEVDGSEEEGDLETESGADSVRPLQRGFCDGDDHHSRSDDEETHDSLHHEDSPFDDHYRSDSEGSMSDSMNSDSDLLQLQASRQSTAPRRHPSKCCKDFGHLLEYRTKAAIGSALAIVNCCRSCHSRGGGSFKGLAAKAVGRAKSLRSDMKTFVSIMRDRKVSVPILLYGLLGFIAIIINDVSPSPLLVCRPHLPTRGGGGGGEGEGCIYNLWHPLPL